MAWEKETEDHRQIWERFTRLVTWGTGSVLLIVALMAIFLL
ncbi:MAG: aa3-type cytochrome c oxidase subunit IV [Alphaproteobacteria bacterium]|nr:aa3-type cytochrome c oxidase subunit IV [Alphaproteobacteria bacterium]